jgi:colicin import membrane protein
LVIGSASRKVRISEGADGDIAALLDELDEVNAAAEVAREMSATIIVRALTEEEIQEKEFNEVLRELDRTAREERQREAREQNRRQLEAARQAEEARKTAQAREAAQREARERMAQKATERAVQADRKRLAQLERWASAREAADQQHQREVTAAANRQRWAQITAAFAPPLHNPATDDAQERLAELEWELATRAEQEAADAEARRHQKYLADHARPSPGARAANEWPGSDVPGP